MEKNEQRETRDFMNVDSFSQLPFIRPTGTPLKAEKGIRLFGKDFGGGGGGAEDESESNDTNHAPAAAGKDNDSNGGESSRKFECHYCCRNFPTSQALGGHQNAHKRERQHAKRANLQSAMVHGGLSAADAQLYGLINYRIGSAPAAAPPMPYHHHHHSQPWSGGTRVYGSHVSTNPYSQPPINGSPLALWRVPTVPHNSPPPPQSAYFSRDRSMHPYLAKEAADLKPPSSMISSAAATHQIRFGYDPKPPSVKDNHVSLDLHL